MPVTRTFAWTVHIFHKFADFSLCLPLKSSELCLLNKHLKWICRDGNKKNIPLHLATCSDKTSL